MAASWVVKLSALQGSQLYFYIILILHSVDIILVQEVILQTLFFLVQKKKGDWSTNNKWRIFMAVEHVKKIHFSKENNYLSLFQGLFTWVISSLVSGYLLQGVIIVNVNMLLFFTLEWNFEENIGSFPVALTINISKQHLSQRNWKMLLNLNIKMIIVILIFIFVIFIW